MSSNVGEIGNFRLVRRAVLPVRAQVFAAGEPQPLAIQAKDVTIRE
jgi:hypothetical protein